jgi:hypothetical protein
MLSSYDIATSCQKCCNNRVKLDFTFLEVKVSLNLCMVLFVPPKFPTEYHYNFPGIHVCAFTPIPQLHVQPEYKLACYNYLLPNP